MAGAVADGPSQRIGPEEGNASAGALFAAIGILLFLKLDTGIILPLLIILLGMGTIARTLIGRT